MDRLRQFYQQHLKKIRLIRTGVYVAKRAGKGLKGQYAGYRAPTWSRPPGAKMGERPRLAVICDELTWANVDGEYETAYLTPANWRETMERFRPDLFFCEAAWTGLEDEWGEQICHVRELLTDNRGTLKNILRYCRKAGVPTVFWNKEDTPAFQDGPNSFIDTALLFDHIFTTAEECVPRYQALGHGSVHVMMFGFSPRLFRPLGALPDRRSAVFFGSWYQHNEERCRDMCRMFDAVLEMGMELTIYDRVSGRAQPDRRYPERYAPYVRESIPYPKTCEAMGDARYVLNINTVKDSRTMFARRVFEIMACGRIVLSNESLGLRERFPGRVWFVGEPFDRSREREIAEQNQEEAFARYTFRDQFMSALGSAGLL